MSAGTGPLSGARVRVVALLLGQIFGLLGGAAPRSAEAAAQGRLSGSRPRTEPGWRIGLATDAPLEVGLRLAYDSPRRLRLTLGVGYLPDVYAQAITGAQVDSGAWSPATGELAAQALQSSMVTQLRLGWRPVAGLGLFTAVGYRLFAFGGTATRGDLLAAALGEVTGGSTGLPIPNPFAGSSSGAASSSAETSSGDDYKVAAALHMLDVAVGWRWSLTPRVGVQVAVGWATVVAATVTVTPPAAQLPLLESTLAAEAETRLQRDLSAGVRVWMGNFAVFIGF